MTLRSAGLIAPLAMALLVSGCGGAEPDEVSSTPSTASATSESMAAPAPAPPPSVTSTPTPMAPPAPDALPFRDYLETIGVTGAPAPVAGTNGLTVTVPIPAGWNRYTDPIFGTGVDYVSRGDTTNPSVQLMAIKLDGDFDPRDALRHATTDALPPGTTDAVESFDDYQGFPSMMAQGVDGDSEQYARYVIVDVPSTASRYLVELIIATKLDEPIAQSPDLQQIINGFSVAVT